MGRVSVCRRPREGGDLKRLRQPDFCFLGNDAEFRLIHHPRMSLTNVVIVPSLRWTNSGFTDGAAAPCGTTHSSLPRGFQFSLAPMRVKGELIAEGGYAGA
jgi:hypothetical protein